MRALRWTCAAAMLVSAALAQNPSDVSFTLAAKDGRTTFRMGEAVDVELRFQSSAPGRYRIWTTSGTRYVRIPRFDKFTVEPSGSVVDPLRDIPAQFDGGIAGFPPTPVPLGGDPAVLPRHVNEWISFRQPGRYRITAETTRVETAGRSPTPVPLRSNTIEIEVIAPEPGWAATQLQQAVATLERGDPPPPVIGQIIDARAEQSRAAEMARAGRALRFLETRDAAWALARFFEHGPQAAQQDVRAGLFGSPYRNEVIAAMEEAVAAPDVPITYYYLATLMELVVSSRMGPSPLYPEKDPQAHKAQVEEHFKYLERAKPIEAEYFAKLADAIGRKRGQARAVSLETLVSRGPQPPAFSVIAALAENFKSLPPASQHNLLTMEWPRIALPSLEPLLRSLAEGSGPVRDDALLRLYDFNPEAARQVAIGRLRNGDVTREMFNNPRALLLPDQTLPELDDALVNALERAKPVELLVARHASESALARVREFSESRPETTCGPLLAYFFRVDPAYAAERLARARRSGGGGCFLSVSGNEDLLMSAGLEKAAIEDLANPNPMVQRTAQTLLQNGGSAAAEQFLWAALARLRESRPTPMDQSMLEFGFLEALSKAVGWILGPEKIDRLMAACLSDNCRTTVTSLRRALQAPVRITLMTMPNGLYADVGPFLLRSRRQLAEKIAQFPKGTRFFLERGYEGTWFREQRTREIRRILDAAGMEVTDQPARK